MLAGIVGRRRLYNTLVGIHRVIPFNDLITLPSFLWHRVRHRPYFGRYMISGQSCVGATCFKQLIGIAGRGRQSIRILEIGSWAGQSAILWARAACTVFPGNAVTVFCVDPWAFYGSLTKSRTILADTMVRAAHADRIFPLFLYNIRAAGCMQQIVPIRASSQVAGRVLRENSFDIVYIDGDHAYLSVQKDIQNYSPLICEGGVLCGDDLDLQLHEVDKEYAYAHRDEDYILDPKTGKWFHPGVTLAVGEFLGRLEMTGPFWAVQKCDCWETVDLSPGE